MTGQQRFLLRLRQLLAGSARDLLATVALVALAVGLWWERLSLALIVPGALVLVAVAAAHLRGDL